MKENLIFPGLLPSLYLPPPRAVHPPAPPLAFELLISFSDDILFQFL